MLGTRSLKRKGSRRLVVVRVLSETGKTLCREIIPINRQNKILAYRVPTTRMIIKEPNGIDFEKVYRNISKVEFSDQKEYGYQVVFLHKKN